MADEKAIPRAEYAEAREESAYSFSVVAGVDDILLDEGAPAGKRALPPDGERRSIKRGLYWVEGGASGRRARGAPAFGLWPAATRIFRCGELEVSP